MYRGWRRTSKQGFTLVELLVVVTIIILLASIVVTALGGARKKALNSRRLSDVHQIGLAVELYASLSGHYPRSLATTTECAASGPNWIPDSGDYSWSIAITHALPRDPSGNCAGPSSPRYSYWSDGTKYSIGAKLEDTTTPNGGQVVYYDGTAYTSEIGVGIGQLALYLSSSQTSPTNQSPISIVATFSNPVIDFTQAAIQVFNGILESFTAGVNSVYTFFVTPRSNGVVTVSIPGGVVHDQQGHSNNAAEISVTYDTQYPHVALSPDPLPVTVWSPFLVQVNFTLPVVDFDDGDITVTNGTASGVVLALPQNGANYAFTVTPTAPGPVSIVINADRVHSAAQNGNVTSNTLFTTYAP